MPRWLLHFLDVLFLVFHTALVAFNTLGWAWPRWRRWNLATLVVTALAWLGMGLWYGIGYCVCTDWHWQVRRALGIRDLDETYVGFLLRLATGYRADPTLVRTGTATVFVLCLAVSLALNLRDRSRARGSSARLSTGLEAPEAE